MNFFLTPAIEVHELGYDKPSGVNGFAGRINCDVQFVPDGPFMKLSLTEGQHKALLVGQKLAKFVPPEILGELELAVEQLNTEATEDGAFAQRLTQY